MRQSLTNIDTSFWKIKDNEWKLEREANWTQIELMLGGYKKKKGLNIIKAYYLSGKMPNWKALREWTDETRHVDLFLFLWLHPSWDEQILKELRNVYINSSLITRWDLLSGFDIFIDSQAVRPTTPLDMTGIDCPPYIEGYGELLFDVMFGNPIQTEFELPPLTKLGKTVIAKVQGPDLRALQLMSRWLTLERELNPLQNGFLYQYEKPIDWWCEAMEDSDSFNRNQINRILMPHVAESLNQIYKFDLDQEGITCRSQFVRRIRKILDERNFFPEFKRIWSDVKEGKFQISNTQE